MQRNFINATLSFVVAAALSVCSLPALADWNYNNPQDFARAKWIQMPDLAPTGMDVLDTIQPISPVPSQWKSLADDFQCTQSGPITDAHIWGSWLNDQLPVNTAGLSDPSAIEFLITFWTDVPAGTGGIPYSRPGNLLWRSLFQPGQFTVNPNVLSAQEAFYDPNVGQIIGNDTQVYQYNFPNLYDPMLGYFTQTVNTIYWFEVQANVLGTAPATFGWKTRDPIATNPGGGHFMDDAVFADTNGFGGAYTSFWRDMVYPGGHPLQGQSIDLSFVLTVPEPSSVAMAGLSLAALGVVVYRRRFAKTS